MKKPIIITLRGNIHIFDEKMDRIQKETGLDVYSQNEIVYPDLVFTLKHKKTYLKPLVKKTKHEFQIVSNPLFFKAAKEAGLENINFDLQVEGEVERVISDYHLEYPEEPIRMTATDTMLFFKQKPKNVSRVKGEVRINPASTSEEYASMNCVRYSIPIFGNNVPGINLIENKFIDSMVERNGKLRSIDGLIKKYGRFLDYFD